MLRTKVLSDDEPCLRNCRKFNFIFGQSRCQYLKNKNLIGPKNLPLESQVLTVHSLHLQVSQSEALHCTSRANFYFCLTTKCGYFPKQH